MSDTYTIVVHPSLVTYDIKTVRTWEQYDRRRKHNLDVKRFREAINYQPPSIEQIIENVRKEHPDWFDFTTLI